MIYFTSDLHMSHRNILDFCPKRADFLGIPQSLIKNLKDVKKAKRAAYQAHRKSSDNSPFKACPSMQGVLDALLGQLMELHNQSIVDILNRHIKKRDILYIIGDFSFGNVKTAKHWLYKINGTKILISGNHDKSARTMLSIGFHDVFENHIIKLSDKTRVLTSHFPYYPTITERLISKLKGKYVDVRYPHKRVINQGEWLLHGHTHSQDKIKGKSIHVGIDAWEKPVSENIILNIIKNS